MTRDPGGRRHPSPVTRHTPPVIRHSSSVTRPSHLSSLQPDTPHPSYLSGTVPPSQTPSSAACAIRRAVHRHPSPARDREGEVGGVSRSPLPCRSATMLTAYLTGDGRSLQSAAPSNSFCAYPLAVTPCGLCELSAPPSARLVSTRPAPAFCGAPQLSSANETTKQQGHADFTGLNASFCFDS